MKLETIKIYFETLKVLRNTLKYTDKIKNASFVKEHHVSGSFFTVLNEGKIISQEGIGRNKVSKWIGIEPNIKMAEETLFRCNEIARKAQNKGRKSNNPELKERDKREDKQKKLIQLDTNAFKANEKVVKNSIITTTITKTLFGFIPFMKTQTTVQRKSD